VFANQCPKRCRGDERDVAAYDEDVSIEVAESRHRLLRRVARTKLLALQHTSASLAHDRPHFIGSMADNDRHGIRAHAGYRV